MTRLACTSPTASPSGPWPSSDRARPDSRRGDLTLPLPALRARWVPESRVVYIGMASRPREGSTNSLRRRLSAYLRYGAGGDARHSGGYPTWQLRDAERLLIAWCVLRPPRMPRTIEIDLCQAHVAKFGALPFANTAG